MKIITLYLLLIIASLFNTRVAAQEPSIIKWETLKQIIHPASDTTYVINFWATWCAPCVKELPNFERLADENKNSKVQVIFISLDFKRQFETRLKPFVDENKMNYPVYLLDEPDYNTWIDKVDPSWGGSIPATLVINNKTGLKKFFEQEFTYEELSSIVKPLILK